MEWKSLGTELEISPAKIKEIDVNNRGQVAECKHDMVQFWLESDTSCSWNKLIDALISNNQSVLAEEIRNSYCHSSQSKSLHILICYTLLFCYASEIDVHMNIQRLHFLNCIQCKCIGHN